MEQYIDWNGNIMKNKFVFIITFSPTTNNSFIRKTVAYVGSSIESAVKMFRKTYKFSDWNIDNISNYLIEEYES